MSFTTRAVLGATVAAAVCLSAAGCASQGASQGSSAGAAAKQPAKPADPLAHLTAQQIAAKAVSNLMSAPGFTMSGTAPVEGHTATMSIEYNRDRCSMTMDMGSQGSMMMIMIGKTMWMKADGKFWNSAGGSGAGSSAATNMFAGKYVKMPTGTGTQVSSSAGMCDTSDMTSSSSVLAPSAKLVKGALSTVNGQRVYPLTDKSKKVTVYVTDTSAPRVIELAETESGTVVKLSVTYRVAGPITAPPASETVTMPGMGS